MYGGSGDYYSRSGSSRAGSGGGSRDRHERVPSRYRSPSPPSYDRYRSDRGSSSRYERSPPRRRSPSPRYRSSGGGGSSRYRSPSPGPSYSRHGGSSSSRDARPRRDSSPDRHDKDRRERSDDRSERSERRVPTAEDNRNVLERMEKSFTDGPLDALKCSIKEGVKVKVWTRNYKEVRGICTGFVLAFDKHWNIIMKDVDEVYLKPRKSKTPFLRELKPGESELIPEMTPKVPKEKKNVEKGAGDTPMETDKTVKETGQSESGIESAVDVNKGEGEGAAEKTKKKRRKKRKTPLMCKRHIPKVFIRGDNVVMVALTSDASESRPEQSGDEDA